VQDSSAPLPSPATPIFTGREDILNQLDDYFKVSEISADEEKCRVFVLYGLGGGGKTQIVLKFIDKFCNR
jgi:hypothetical protein